MNLIQKIKSFFIRNKTKKLSEQNTIREEKISNCDKESLIEVLQKDVISPGNNTNITKSDKIREMLKSIGCKKEVFIRVEDFECIDLDNLVKVIDELNKFKFSKHQFNVIFGQNINILTTKCSVIEKNIRDLLEYINNLEAIKNIIYTNPYLLTTAVKNRIINVKEIFGKLGFSLEEQEIILEENSNILTLNKNTLKKSVDVIVEYCESIEHCRQYILENPIVIGITDIEILKNYE